MGGPSATVPETWTIARAPGFHGGQSALGQRVDTGQFVGQLRLEILPRQALHRGGHEIGGRGIADQRVQAATGGGLPDQLGRLLRVADIALYGDGGAAVRGDLRYDLVGRVPDRGGELLRDR
jgi:hypothetical protein